ncbi:MAG: NAD(P)H-dependent glycerol-3-phosphate dehydrogenase [Acidimicrobiales bacterium]
MEIRVGVAGGGSWGTTVASLAAHNTPTTVWARDAEVVDGINNEHRNVRYMPDLDLHPDLRATTDLAEMVSGCDVLVMGVPSHAMRETAKAIEPYLRAWVPIVSLSKGLEQGSMLRMTEVIGQELPGHPVGVLTGPNLAKEILSGYAAAAVVAMTDPTLAVRLQEIFATESFRVYTTGDVIGAELGGALKNVIALASGMADGLGTGDNTRAAVITRGLAELTRLGVAMGGQPETFAGLAGMGDLVATCISTQSRNRHVGERLGQGQTIEQVIEEMNQVAEGVKTVPVVIELAARYGIEVPITSEVAKVISEGAAATEAYEGLLRRRTGLEADPAEPQ